ncbi:GAF domain protein [Toxoplasma gondii TgCatPRC2]|uniref:GAF domain protein n=4 Tax=Toxoplasma gondii TaxID=5811 RepID=A0A151HEQ9_TOXGO|nr:hypothetical protein TGME49_236510 [Toxoplasma gondii ME49]EPT26665.1 hypothetical protein TGME49_236510 [Toxoplasma gondii ME49]KFG31716.1 GAF domain protein [Toxoplasma gondii GAB2-2007-GAL-DOM2]KYF43077.1 GAF domain protein [Toxoplasma gondii ARI]KYK67798.1 GAF domain protein [Toxoplasma gondii TgCatPRC2]|eukprot:XP_018635793.1 hypothetical protein TGME49_236510 [Toxoplasma gondii ME49]
MQISVGYARRASRGVMALEGLWRNDRISRQADRRLAKGGDVSFSRISTLELPRIHLRGTQAQTRLSVRFHLGESEGGLGRSRGRCLSPRSSSELVGRLRVSPPSSVSAGFLPRPASRTFVNLSRSRLFSPSSHLPAFNFVRRTGSSFLRAHGEDLARDGKAGDWKETSHPCRTEREAGGTVLRRRNPEINGGLEKELNALFRVRALPRGGRTEGLEGRLVEGSRCQDTPRLCMRIPDEAFCLFRPLAHLPTAESWSLTRFSSTRFSTFRPSASSSPASCFPTSSSSSSSSSQSSGAPSSSSPPSPASPFSSSSPYPPPPSPPSSSSSPSPSFPVSSFSSFTPSWAPLSPPSFSGLPPHVDSDLHDPRMSPLPVHHLGLKTPFRSPPGSFSPYTHPPGLRPPASPPVLSSASPCLPPSSSQSYPQSYPQSSSPSASSPPASSPSSSSPQPPFFSHENFLLDTRGSAAAAAAATAALESISRAEKLLAVAGEAAAARALHAARENWEKMANRSSGSGDVDELRQALLLQVAAAETKAAEDALKRAGAFGGASQPPPSRRDLWLLSLSSSLPFVGFGLVDNCIMIVAGDLFDTTLCVTLGLTTMAAAALGNWISDLMGLWLGSRIEALSSRILPIPKPSLTPEQRESPICRKHYYIGTGIGISIGCLLGMAPLLFLDTQEGERRKQQREQARVLHSEVAAALQNYLQAEHVVLYLLDSRDNAFYTLVDGQRVCVPSHSGTPGVVFETGKLISWEGRHVKDNRKTPEPLPEREKSVSLSSLSSLLVASPLCAVINDNSGDRSPASSPSALPSSPSSPACFASLPDNGGETVEVEDAKRRQVETPALLSAFSAFWRRARRQESQNGGTEDAETETNGRASPEEKKRAGERSPTKVSEADGEKTLQAKTGNETHEIGEDVLPLPGVHTPARASEVRHVLAAPVFGFEGNIIGVIEVINPVGRARFSREDRDFLISICPHIAVEIEGHHHLTKILELCRKQVASREKATPVREHEDKRSLELQTDASLY